MSGRSIGSIIGGIIGAILSPFTGGMSMMAMASIGMMAGGLIGGLLDPEKGPEIQGPRLSDLNQQVATYGTFIPRVYGMTAMYGNVFWIENNKLKEVETKSGGGGKGAPSGSTTTSYTYYATFALGLCEGPILDIGRIWFSGKLWYNGKSEDKETLEVSTDKKTKFNIYYGTEDQMPDTRMQADVGIADCPAYRGLAYIVFYDVEMTAYGNSLAGLQVKVEVVKQGNYGAVFAQSQSWKHPYLEHGYGSLVDGNNLFINGGHNLWWFDITKPDKPQYRDVINIGKHKIDSFVKRDNLIITGGREFNQIIIFTHESGQLFYNNTHIIDSVPTSLTYNGDKLYVVGTTKFYVFTIFWNGLLVEESQINLPNTVFISSIQYFSGKAYVARGASLYVIDVSNPSSISIIATLGLTSNSDATSGSDLAEGYLYIGAGNGVNVFNINGTVSLTSFFPLSGQGVSSIKYKSEILFVTYSQANNVKAAILNAKNKSNITLVEEYSPTVAHNGGTIGGQIAEKDGYYYLSVDYVNPGSLIESELFLTVYANKNISDSTVVLGDIVKSECLLSRLVGDTDIDVSDLSQNIRGYRVSSIGAIRGGIDPLQACWPFDIIQDGYKIKFVARGHSSIATITSDKLASQKYGDNKAVKITKIREMDSILPARVNVNYHDYAREYDVGQQFYERINTDAINVTNLEISVVLTAAEAYGKAQTLCYLYWMERYDFNFTLPNEYIYLQPSDVITIILPGEEYVLRIKQINYTQTGFLEITAKLNRPAIYAPTEITDEGQIGSNSLLREGATTFELLDLPSLDDQIEKPGYIMAMTGAENGWPGGALLRSDDGGQSYILLQSIVKPGSVFGYAVNSIGADKGLLFDKSSELIVKLVRGELESVTELAMLNGANHFAYGLNGRYEILSAQNCVLQADGTYKLTDMIRGRLGTEQYTGTHQDADHVVFLTKESVRFISYSENFIGQQRVFKGINVGETLDTGQEYTFKYGAENTRCLNPIYIRAGMHPANYDITIDFIRRTRIGYAWRDLVDVSLGEKEEKYDIEIYFDNTFTTLKRTITNTTTSALYTYGQQKIDFGLQETSSNFNPNGDQFYNKRVLGLHFNGSNNSTSFTDNSPISHSVNVIGGAKISTSQSKFGGSSCSIPSLGDGLSIPYSSYFNFSGDFTISGFFNISDLPLESTAAPGYYESAIIGNYDATGANPGWIARLFSNNTGTQINRIGLWSDNIDLIINFNFSLNTWYHFAYIRKGTTCYGFIDGVLLLTRTLSTHSFIKSNNTPLNIGWRNQSGFYSPLQGYLDDLYIYNGYALWTQDFFVPTNQFDDFQKNYQDFFYRKRVLGLHFNGANNSTTFVENSPTPKIVAAVGNTKIIGNVGVFDGNGSYLSVAHHPDFNLGSSDFTIKVKVKFNGWPVLNDVNTYYFFLVGKDLEGGREFTLQAMGTANSLTSLSFAIFPDNNTNQNISVSYGFELNTTYDIAIVRSNNICYVFIDGLLQNVGGTTLNATIQTTTSPLKIGSNEFNANYKGYLNGTIDELYIWKGVGLHTSSFIPNYGEYYDFAPETLTELNIKVYQISAITGRGYPGTATIKL